MNYTFSVFRSGLIAFGVVALLLLGSRSVADGNPRSLSSPAAARVGREFKLKARHEVTLKGEGLRIRFAEVKEDSRCPADVKCVWAGTAKVRVEVSYRGRGRKSLTLSLLNNSAPVDYRNYKISLVGLSPYPRSDKKIAPRDYEATLLVNRN